MQSRVNDFLFSPNFNWGNDSLFNSQSSLYEKTFPPVAGNFELLNGTPFLLLNGTNFLLL